jgi:hypothetical protein
MSKIAKTAILAGGILVALYFLCTYTVFKKNSNYNIPFSLEKKAKILNQIFDDIYPNTTEERLARLNSFKLNHERILKTLNPRKFCYVIPSQNGYGNKLISVVTAFLVALVTDSAVIINMASIGQYIQEPLYKCFQENSSINNELSYLYDPQSVYDMPVSFTNVSYKVKKDLTQLYLNIPKGYDRYRFAGYGLALYYEIACNRQYFNTFLFYGLVKPSTIENALAVLDSPEFNKSTDQAINTMYSIGFEVAHNILENFWQPMPSIQREVKEFVSKYFNGHFVIGMQFRFEFLFWSDVELFFQCAKSLYAVSKEKRKKTMKW